MGEKFTSRVGYLIRNFRIASDMTQKELAPFIEYQTFDLISSIKPYKAKTLRYCL